MFNQVTNGFGWSPGIQNVTIHENSIVIIETSEGLSRTAIDAFKVEFKEKYGFTPMVLSGPIRVSVIDVSSFSVAPQTNPTFVSG